MSKLARQFRHLRGLLRSARFAKEGAIAATDELHAVAGQSDRRFPQGVAGEGGCFDLVVGEQRLGDRAVGCAFPAPVDRTQHLPEAYTALGCQSRIRRNAPAFERQQEARQCVHPVDGVVIEQDDGGQQRS